MKRNTGDTVQSEPFELKLPDDFNIKPVWEVELPSKCKALIYTDKVWGYADTKNRNEQILLPGWRVIVVNKNGRTPRVLSSSGFDRHSSDRHGGHRYSSEDPLNIMLHLKELAFLLSKTKKAQFEDVDPED